MFSSQIDRVNLSGSFGVKSRSFQDRKQILPQDCLPDTLLISVSQILISRKLYVFLLIYKSQKIFFLAAGFWVEPMAQSA